MNHSHDEERIAIFKRLLDLRGQADQGIRDACRALLDSYNTENRLHLQSLLEGRLKIDEMLETAKDLCRSSTERLNEVADIFHRRKNTPLTLLGYRTGAKARLSTERQRKLRAIWKSDLGLELTADQFRASAAESYGAPGSQERLFRMIGELRWNAIQQSKVNNEDSARHFTEDAAYLESLLVSESGAGTPD
jgi:hypothetical protein